MKELSTRRLPTIVAAAVSLFSLACLPAFAQFADPTGGSLFPLPAASAPSAAAQKSASLWQTAVRLHKANKLAEAAKSYQAFLRAAKEANLPQTSLLPAYQNMTALYRQQGAVNELIDALKHWSGLAAGNAALHAELANLYAGPKQQKFDDAAREARLTLALKPTKVLEAAARSALGIVSVGKHDYAAAEQEFGTAARLAPFNAQMHYNYALALLQRKKFMPALAAMRKAAAANPKLAGAWYYIGLLNENQEKFPEALKAFHQAVHLAPRDPTIHFDLARVQVRTNDIEGAITSYLTALEFAPESVPARVAAALLYVQLHNYDSGRIHYTEAVRLAPKNAQALAGLAECEMQLSQRPQEPAAHAALLKHAEEHYRAAAQIDPRYLVGPSSLAHFFEQTANYAHAQEIYSNRITADPKDFTNYNALAGTYIMQRKADEAVAVWRRFRDRYPDNPISYMRVADTLEAQTKWTDAVAEWKLLLTRKLPIGTQAAAMVSAGRDLSRAGQNKEAVEQLEAILKLDTSGSASPPEARLAAVATIQAERLEAMRELAQAAERVNSLGEAIRWQQQIKAEEAAAAEKAHTAPNAATYLALARLYQRDKRPELAIKELDAVTQTNQVRKENLVPAFEEMAQVYESEKRYDDAVIAYRRAASYSKEPLNGRLRVAEVYQRSGRLPLAIAEYETIRKDAPKEVRVLAPLALALRQAGRDEDAVRVYDDLLQSDPRATWARDQKAAVLTHMKRYDEARALYESQLAQNGQNRQLYADIAFVFQSEGKPNAFLDWAVPRLEKTPTNATLMAVIMDEAVRQKKEEQGWAILRASVQKNKDQRAILEATAALMAQRGRKDDAAELYRELAAKYPNDLSAQIAYADQLLTAGHKEQASGIYGGLMSRADLSASQKLTVRRQYVRSLTEQGETTLAMAQLQAIVKEDPNDFDSASRLALQLEAAGRGAEAIPVLESLATREVYGAAVRAQIRNKLGGLYLKRGDKTAAAAAYRMALTLNPKDTTAEAALAQLGKP